MKRFVFSVWLMVLSIAAMAQTFVVIDKSGNRKTFDVGRLDSVTFQQNPPAFTVYENTSSTPSWVAGFGPVYQQAMPAE